MDACDTLATIESRGVRLWLVRPDAYHPEDVRIRVSDGDRVADLADLIREHKPTLIALLEGTGRLRALQSRSGFWDGVCADLPEVCVGHPDRPVYRFNRDGTALCDICADRLEAQLMQEARAVAVYGPLFS